MFASMDFVLRVKKAGRVVELAHSKLREEEPTPALRFRFWSVELGHDEDGNRVSSAVLVRDKPGDGDERKEDGHSRGELSAVEQVLLATLRSLGGSAKTGVWQKRAEEEAKVTESKFYKARTKLVEKGFLVDADGPPRLTDAGLTAAANLLPEAAEGSRPH